MINGDRPALGPNAGPKARKMVRRALGAASDAVGLPAALEGRKLDRQRPVSGIGGVISVA